MGLFGFLRGQQAPAAPQVSAPQEPEPLTPEQSTELEQAWTELNAAADAAGVTDFRVCTRDGSSRQQNPAAVRAIAATIRDLHD